MKIFIAFVLGIFIVCPTVFAHPEFQAYSRKVSGRSVNCAMCHKHPDGPTGLKSGQIGSLSEEEIKALGLARQAMLPGSGVKSPILNEFGNSIVDQLGREKITMLKMRPELLAEALSKIGDQDNDGIMDAEEFLDGTHPLNSLDGHPWKLFKNNLAKNWFHILMLGLATGCGLYGLYNALLWLSMKARREE